MPLMYAFTLPSRTIGNCCSAATADCAPICASSDVEKRLNPALTFVCAFAMAALNARTIASETNLVRFIPGLLRDSPARLVPASDRSHPRLDDGDERGDVGLIDEPVAVHVAAPARRRRRRDIHERKSVEVGNVDASV